MRFFEVKNNELIIGGIPAVKLTAEFGSPLYVYDEAVIRDRYRKLFGSIPYEKKRIHYAMKANGNIQILRVLKEEGCHIDAVSKEEVMVALKAGFESEKILFTGMNMTLEDMEYAVKNGVRINVGSLGNLENFGRNFPGQSVSIRINPDFGAGHHDHVVTGGRKSKFGIFYSSKFRKDIDQAIDILKEHKLKLAGVQAHIGSGVLDEGKFIELMQIILKLANDIPGLEFVDFGGGIGVPYRPEEKDFNLEAFGKHASKMMEDFAAHYGARPYMALEPGRFLSAESGYFLVTVTDIKNNPDYTFAGVDSGFNHLIRPMAYGSYHPILNASRVEGGQKEIVVAGYICESGDVFTRGEHGLEARNITEPRAGDVLAILNSGAYGYSMASNYNYRPRPAEVLVSGGTARLIRKRETIEDILRTQVV
jgi:diaminopimelate decarboxylase